MAISNMKVFQDFVYGSMTETVDQQINKFNEASAGALRLTTASNIGDIKQKASFAAVQNLIRRRNAYGSTAVTASPLSQRQENTVKVAGGTSPIQFEQQQFRFIQENPKVAGVMLGEQLSAGIVKDTAIRCATAAIGGVAALQSDVSAGTTTYASLNTAQSKFGDFATNIRCWVIHSKVLFDLYGNALSGSNYLFQYDTVNVMKDPFGRMFVVTDSPALINGSGKYMTLGLVSDAVMVEDNGDFHDNILETNGSENIQTTYQAEWTYQVGVRGYSWTAATGGASPTDTALGTSANWTKTSSFNKTTAGVMMISA
jgi:Major capsid protein 13-like